MPENADPDTSDLTSDEESQPAEETLEFWRDKANSWQKRAMGNSRRVKELEPKAAQFDALEQASKSDLERFQEKLAETTRQATEAERRALVASVALEKGLPASLARRLQGETQADLEADADELLAQFPQSDNGPRRPAPDPSQGSSANGQSPDQSDTNWLTNLVRK